MVVSRWAPLGYDADVGCKALDQIDSASETIHSSYTDKLLLAIGISFVMRDAVMLYQGANPGHVSLCQSSREAAQLVTNRMP